MYQLERTIDRMKIIVSKYEQLIRKAIETESNEDLMALGKWFQSEP